jgi:hypothetical protein
MDSDMIDKLYYNKVTQEFGVSFDRLNTEFFPNTSLMINIEAIDDWVSYTQLDRPTVQLYQTVVEGVPTFTETVDHDTQEIILSDGMQNWVVADKIIDETLLTELRTFAKAKITQKRKETEVGGLLFPNGVSIKTSKEDQDRILSVIINAERNGIEEIDFKADSGWARVSIFALKQMAKELTFFVQHCFNVEKMNHEVIELLTDPVAIVNYSNDLSWEYVFESVNTEPLVIYDMSYEDVMTVLYSNFIFPTQEGVDVLISPTQIISAQALIDKAYYGMKDLIPTQFYYLLANSGLDDAIDVLLQPLRTENLAKYSMYKSYLNGARFYEFSKAYHMYLDIKEKILVVDPSLNFNVDQLKLLWTEASNI